MTSDDVQELAAQVNALLARLSLGTRITACDLDRLEALQMRVAAISARTNQDTGR